MNISKVKCIYALLIATFYFILSTFCVFFRCAQFQRNILDSEAMLFLSLRMAPLRTEIRRSVTVNKVVVTYIVHWSDFYI